MKVYVGVEASYTHFYPRHYIAVSGHLHATAAIIPATHWI